MTAARIPARFSRMVQRYRYHRGARGPALYLLRLAGAMPGAVGRSSLAAGDLLLVAGHRRGGNHRRVGGPKGGVLGLWSGAWAWWGLSLRAGCLAGAGSQLSVSAACGRGGAGWADGTLRQRRARRGALRLRCSHRSRLPLLSASRAAPALLWFGKHISGSHCRGRGGDFNGVHSSLRRFALRFRTEQLQLLVAARCWPLPRPPFWPSSRRTIRPSLPSASISPIGRMPMPPNRPGSSSLNRAVCPSPCAWPRLFGAWIAAPFPGKCARVSPADAPNLDLRPPTFTVLESTPAGARRAYRTLLRSERGAPYAAVLFPSRTPRLSSVRIEGQPLAGRTLRAPAACSTAGSPMPVQPPRQAESKSASRCRRASLLTFMLWSNPMAFPRKESSC